MLRDAIDRVPTPAAAHHALGLLEIRGGQPADAAVNLEVAAVLAPEVARYAYVYAIALNEVGRADTAVVEHITARTRVNMKAKRNLLIGPSFQE